MSRDGPAAPARCPRVLMIIKRPGGLGGMQVQGGRVALRLQKLGVPVSLLARAPEPGAPNPWWTERLPARMLSHHGGEWGFAAQVFATLVRCRGDYDVVHVHGLAPETVAAVAARLVTGRRLCVKPSTAGPNTRLHRQRSRAHRFLGARWWRAVDAWISISEATTADLVGMGIASSRIHSIPNGVDTSRYFPLPAAERTALRRRLGIPEETVLVLSAGRLVPQKRMTDLVQAFLAASSSPRAVLHVAGEGGERPRIEAVLSGQPGAGRVRLLGPTPSSRLAEWFQAADVFALLSGWEGLSNALLEAMACGVPPLVTDVSGMRDVVTEGETGLVVPPANVEAAAAGLRRLLGQPELRARLGTAAAERIRMHYSLDATCARLIALYADLVSPCADTAGAECAG